MSNDSVPPGGVATGVDADAVCVQCGSVNPEGALLCKQCGNNLRDQRAQRLVAEVGRDTGTFSVERQAWLSKAFTVLGILLVIWVALNVGRIEEVLTGVDVLTGVQSQQARDPGVYWSGPDNVVFEAMLAKLKANPVTENDALTAQELPPKDRSYEGCYILVEVSPLLQQSPLGQAWVRRDGARLLFVALLVRGAVEIRGEAQLERDGAQLAARDSAGVMLEDAYIGASGFAQELEMGGYQCFGLLDTSEDSYSVLAFRLPE